MRQGLRRFIDVRPLAVAVVVLAIHLCTVAPPASADEPPYEFDATLSLNGNCKTTSFDPVIDPSCVGEPPSYPAPPTGPSGQLIEPRAIAIDGAGNEYVASFAAGDDAKGRVHVFDDEGHFVTEVAVKDAKSIAVDSKGNLYVFEAGGNVVRYPAKKYEAEGGVIEYGEPPVAVVDAGNNGAVAIDTSPLYFDQLLVVNNIGVVTRYSSAATGNEVIDSFTVPGAFPNSLAIDSERRRIYASYCKEGNIECVIGVFSGDAPHTLIEEIAGTPEGKFASFAGALAVAVDEDSGDFFIYDPEDKSFFQYDEDYAFLSGVTSETLAPSETINVQIAVSNGTRALDAGACEYPTPDIRKVPAGDACNRHYLFIPRFRKTGSALAYRPPGQTPPVIEGVATAGIGETEAELRAVIDPRGLETTYRFEITTQEAFETEGFASATALGEGTIPANSLATEVSVFATGLISGQTYRFRAVAENELGSAPGKGQNEAGFTTYEDAAVSPPGSCPNEALRLGRSAFLPDCRAYELVTPADTNGRSPEGMSESGFTVLQASPAGDAVSFKIEGGSLPGASGSASYFGDPYVSRRGDSGWTTELAGPSGEEAPVTTPGGFSPDQTYSYWTARVEGPLVVEGQQTRYIRYPDGHSEMLGMGSLGSDPTAQISLIAEDGIHIIFSTVNLVSAGRVAVQLEPNAPPTGTEAVYDRTIDPVTGDEEVHVVSLLPGDVTPEAGENARPRGQSADGEGVAFEIGNTIYLRVNNEATYEIGEDIEVAGVSDGGRRLVYLEGGDLKAFDVASEEVIAFTSSGDVTPVNVAPGGIRVAFVSPSVLGGANPEGELAQPGGQNLYVSEEGAVSFVATVTDRDVEGEVTAGVEQDGLGLWMDVGDERAKDPSRFSPSGSVLLFQSRANLTGYPASEFPQIYRYDGAAGELACISCIPTGRPASGGAALESYGGEFSPEPLGAISFVPNLTPDGKRVFFNSTEALVSSDTDEVMDVYEWEASGVGSCKEPGGCVYLISSGVSERANYLYGHSTSGDDVFFTTGDTLTGWDSTDGAVSVYDARVGGGFPEPKEEEICVGDGCRPSVTPSPPPPVIQSSTQGRSGNVEPKICPNGKRKVNKKMGKTVWVKKKQKA